MISIKSEKLKQIINLENFLTDKISKHEDNQTSCLAYWGNETIKDNPKNLPTLRIVDNLYFGYGTENKPFGIFFSYDDNIYYNNSKENNISNLLASDWTPSEEEVKESYQAIEMINKYCISKRNQYPMFSSEEEIDPSNSVILFDQPTDSESIISSNINQYNFHHMFVHAFEHFSNGKIYIKYHEDCINKNKEGYLEKFLKKNKLLDHPSVRIIKENCNPASFFYYFDNIFTVTSPIGFEAILRGRNVTTFGESFYSGYGFTTDNLSKPKKKERRPLEVFIALFLKNSIYLNPNTNSPGSILDVLEYISLQQRHKNDDDILFFRSNIHKSNGIGKLLNSNKIKSISLKNRSDILINKEKLIISDSQKALDQIPKQNKKAFINNGFLFNANSYKKSIPISLIYDNNSSYLETQQYSDLHSMIEQEELTSFELTSAQKLLRTLKQLITQSLQSHKPEISLYLKENKPIILVPGNKDENYYSSHIQINNDIDLLKKIISENNNVVIIYKPIIDKNIIKEHENEINSLLKETKNKLFVDTNNHYCHLINISNEIHVVNNPIAITSLIMNKPVVTYSDCFYANRGLTKDKITNNKKHITLEELIAFSYMLYPRYKLIDNDKFISAQNALDIYLDKYQENIKHSNSHVFQQIFTWIMKS